MINITLSNGSFIQWKKDQFTDYMYDGKCFIVIKERQWVGIYNSVKYAQKQGVTIGMGLASDMARAFCQAVRAAGYDAINYANPDYLNRYFDKAVQEEFPLWLAQWPDGTPSLDKPPRTCDIWQYSEKGSVPGISGDVDLDVCYREVVKHPPLTDRQKVQKAAGLSDGTMDFLECYKYGSDLLRKLAAAMEK